MTEIKKLQHSLIQGQTLLGNDRRESLLGFLRSRRDENGAFLSGSSRPDLYYSVFGLSLLKNLGDTVDSTPLADWLFGHSVESLDLIHLCSLAHCLGTLQIQLPKDFRSRILRRMDCFLMEDGGYALSAGDSTSSAYPTYLAILALESLEAELPDVKMLLRGLMQSMLPDGSWPGSPAPATGTAPSTAAAIVIHRKLGLPAPQRALDWLSTRCFKSGGFSAVPESPHPDLLSTATVLQACDSVLNKGEALTCFGWIDSLWLDAGGFPPVPRESTPDVEYSFYALLALGRLAPLFVDMKKRT